MQPAAEGQDPQPNQDGDHPGAYVGIEIGGTKLQIVAGGGPREITRRWRAAVRPADGGPGIQRQLRAGLAEVGAAVGGSPARAPNALCAVGVGFGGPVNRNTGRIARSHQIDGWENFDLAGWLRDETSAGGRPAARVVVDNDANVAALAEACHGAGTGLDPVFYVTLGSGVGGGLVAGGAIYHGAPPGEAEFGHLRLGAAGGTVESRCSGWAIDARLRGRPVHPGSGPLADALAGHGGVPGGEARHLAPALAAGDPAAREILDELAADLALALSHVVHLMHPAAIVLGGGLSGIGEPLRAAVSAALPGFVMKALHPCPPVRLAALGEDAVPVGALELACRAGNCNQSS